MEAWLAVIDKVIWPATVMAVVAILRASLSQLIPTLKKLKYKDLELEFEREANQIRAEAERDLPEVEKVELKRKRIDTGTRFSLARVSPVEQVLKSWHEVEQQIYALSNSEINGTKKHQTIRTIVKKLMEENRIEESTANLILALAALRNKVVHANPDTITDEVSSAFRESSQRVIGFLESLRSTN